MVWRAGGMYFLETFSTSGVRRVGEGTFSKCVPLLGYRGWGQIRFYGFPTLGAWKTGGTFFQDFPTLGLQELLKSKFFKNLFTF